MEKLRNNCYKLYFIQISPKNGGQIIYKIGITEYIDILHRFSNYIDNFNIKPLCSLVFKSKEKAEAFENMLLSIYKNFPSMEVLKDFENFNGFTELRSLTNFEKMEILNFMFILKNNSKVAL